MDWTCVIKVDWYLSMLIIIKVGKIFEICNAYVSVIITENDEHSM